MVICNYAYGVFNPLRYAGRQTGNQYSVICDCMDSKGHRGSRMKSLFGARPVLPWAFLYVIGLLLVAVSNFVWEPAGWAAFALAVVGSVGAAVVAALHLARHRVLRPWPWWCALGGALVAVVVSLLGFFIDDSDNSIGPGVGVLVGWFLFAIGASVAAPGTVDS